MKIAVVNNAAPFQRGGAELLAEALVHQLERRGHDVELVRIPFDWSSPEAIVDSMIAARAMVIHGADRVIAFKFPAYLVPHDHKVMWLLHQFRQVYDLWGTEHGYGPGNGDELRAIIERADALCLRDARRIFCNAATTAYRLKTYNGFDAEVLHPPLTHDEFLRHERYGDYVLAIGRVNDAKRQWLAVEAMAHTTTDVKLVIAGPPESEADVAKLRGLIERHGLADRVTFTPGFITEEHKGDLLADALGVVYLPIDEDSYGYVTVEGMTARKPVVTVSDAGGLLQVVRPGRSGFVCDPNPRAVAEAFDQLRAHAGLAAKLGTGGLALVDELGLSWDHVCEVLTS